MRMGQNWHYNPGYFGLGVRGRTGLWLRECPIPVACQGRRGGSGQATSHKGQPRHRQSLRPDPEKLGGSC